MGVPGPLAGLLLGATGPDTWLCHRQLAVLGPGLWPSESHFPVLPVLPPPQSPKHLCLPLIFVC